MIRFEQVVPLMAAIGVGLVILGSMLASVLGVERPQLDVVTSAELITDVGWKLTGRVIFEGAGVPGLAVWAIATDQRGNRYSPPLEVKTGNSGVFTIDGIPARLGGADLQKPTMARGRVFPLEVTVFASGSVKTDDKELTVEGKEILTLGRHGGTRWVELPLLGLVTIPTIFIISIVLALIQARDNSPILKVQYYGSVILAFLFTATMILYVALGLRQVNVTGSPDEVLSLGFANIYHGSYTRDVEPEWLFSLTTPPGTAEPGTESKLAHGFGVPLWVLLVSIVGAGVFTIHIVVKQIRDPVDLAKKEEVRERVQEVVKHQFYILFAPLGAVFVYQMLVIAEAAANPVIVALAALAAGAALNLLLDRAMATAENLLK